MPRTGLISPAEKYTAARRASEQLADTRAHHVTDEGMTRKDRKLSIHELERVSPEDYPKGLERRIRVVLDDVRSRHNVGSIFRTADAFGVEGLILGGFTPLPPHREIEKTALGATASVPWVHAANALDSLLRLREEGYRLIAVEQTEQALALDRFDLPMDQPVAIILGNELNGVSDAIISVCDQCVVIPQRGSKHSLNVSVCAGVVLHWITCAKA